MWPGRITVSPYHQSKQNNENYENLGYSHDVVIELNGNAVNLKDNTFTNEYEKLVNEKRTNNEMRNKSR